MKELLKEQKREGKATQISNSTQKLRAAWAGGAERMITGQSTVHYGSGCSRLTGILETALLGFRGYPCSSQHLCVTDISAASAAAARHSEKSEAERVISPLPSFISHQCLHWRSSQGVSWQGSLRSMIWGPGSAIWHRKVRTGDRANEQHKRVSK